ncbi:MAG: DUF6044 family protein [Bacteroidales bacterium]|nr:DUF6044 family protein [Lachnoclostridium sp.]MCM1383740.1 DUF6044 family protein [Lachnoclostridium sp.]MCM1464368.1 DUF6044 family protein [Bacteroidales bacterium]
MKKAAQGKGIFHFSNKILNFLDNLSLWWMIVPLMAVFFAPYFILGEGSVFDIHDQLDESILNMVLTARHLGENAKVFPEMMGGINASGLQPSAMLFVPLYRILPPFAAFVLQYAICFGAAFLGMYFCVRELTNSSILAVLSGACFCMLPMYPIYGLSEMGIPLLFYALLCLWKGKNRKVSLILVLFFGLTSHLVYTGYAVLSIWGGFLCVSLFRKKKNRWLLGGFLLLTGVYIAENRNLFAELFLGQGDYISHRTEMVNASLHFPTAVWDMFLGSGQHAPSLHGYFILPIIALLLLEGILWRKFDGENKKRYFFALGGMGALFGIALFYGVCKSEPVTAWKNSVEGFLHYFQIERFYWLYPAGWYLELAYTAGILWKQEVVSGVSRERNFLPGRLILLLLYLFIFHKALYNSYFYLSVNQMNNGSGITGYISWESFYSEDLMAEIEATIGRDITTYRVAHLGMSPAPALMHGFYTVDGYSNNYSLEYKHRFRKIIAKELEKNEETKVYFDKWGNRCYLFNGATGNAWMLGKAEGIIYEELEFDMQALKEIGCEYLFSCGEILNAEKMGLSFMGYHETESSYWGIWLYRLTD